jgi:hypothetical protein
MAKLGRGIRCKSLPRVRKPAWVSTMDTRELQSRFTRRRLVTRSPLPDWWRRVLHANSLTNHYTTCRREILRSVRQDIIVQLSFSRCLLAYSHSSGMQAFWAAQAGVHVA